MMLRTVWKIVREELPAIQQAGEGFLSIYWNQGGPYMTSTPAGQIVTRLAQKESELREKYGAYSLDRKRPGR